MLKRLRKAPHQKQAEKAAKDYAPKDSVGGFLGTHAEESSVTSYRFESKLKGYSGWEWQVVVFQSKKAPATISEVLLLPGKTAIVAPAWVPWAERREELNRAKAESAVADLEQTVEPKQDAKDAAENPPIRKRLRQRLIGKKNEDKRKKPSQGAK